MTSTPSPGVPNSPNQSDKSKRYDRQLRLWGNDGQDALEASHVCVINATATTSEILKSLVLPGIGSFTIVDGVKITGEHVGNNFFLEKDDIGKSRAQTATRLLLELNPEVRGDFVDEMPQRLLSNNPDYFNHFSIVIATELPEKTLIELSKQLWKANIPLILVRSYGFIGYIRLQVNECTVVESHPDNILEDLRIDCPFDQLKKYMDTLSLETMDRKQHGHTPYVVILYKYLEKWLNIHQTPPKTYAEKKEFKKFIESGILRKSDNISLEEEENFSEALKAVNTALSSTMIPKNILEILQDDKCMHLKSNSSNFWYITRAVKEFVENEGYGALPLRGTIPDMFSDSERYIQLQNIYRQKASQDVHCVYRRVQDLLEQHSRPAESIAEAEVAKFCKNSYSLRLIRGNAIFMEYETASSISLNKEVLAECETELSDIVYYLILRAVDHYITERSAIPGQSSDSVETDIALVKTNLIKVLSDCSLHGIREDYIDYIHEICRYGGCELHSVAAYVAGVAAQEVIKLLTSQYVPIDNLFIYNAMSTVTTTFKV